MLSMVAQQSHNYLLSFQTRTNLYICIPLTKEGAGLSEEGFCHTMAKVYHDSTTDVCIHDLN